MSSGASAFLVIAIRDGTMLPAGVFREFPATILGAGPQILVARASGLSFEHAQTRLLDLLRVKAAASNGEPVLWDL